MFGYILWCDAASTHAIIWCEDQGDLVFFRNSSDNTLHLQKGDSVTFDLIVQEGLRYASNLRTVSQLALVELAEHLQDQVQTQGRTAIAPVAEITPDTADTGKTCPRDAGEGNNVLEFPHTSDGEKAAQSPEPLQKYSQ